MKRFTIILIFLITLVSLISYANNQKQSFSLIMKLTEKKSSQELIKALRKQPMPLDTYHRIIAFQNKDSQTDRDIMLRGTGFPNYYETLSIKDEGYIKEAFKKGHYIGLIKTDSLATARVYFSPETNIGKAYWRQTADADSCYITAEYKTMWSEGKFTVLWERETGAFLVLYKADIIGEMLLIDGEWLFVNTTSRILSESEYIFVSDKTLTELKEWFKKHHKKIYQNFMFEVKKSIK